MTSIKAQLQGTTDRELAKQTLLNEDLSDDNLTIYTIVRTVSSSGMSRKISFKYVQDNNIYDITYLVAQALGDKVVDANGFNAIRVNGAGMDMSFHMVYNLSSVLYAGQDRAGYVLSQRAL